MKYPVAWSTRADLIGHAESHGWTTRHGNRSLLFNHPDGRELVVTWEHVPQLPFTQRWCKFVGAEMFIPAPDERFAPGMCGTTDYVGSSYSGLDNVRDWLADEGGNPMNHDKPVGSGACACGFVPSSMSDQPGETMALHICQSNQDCMYWSECRITARCLHRRAEFDWLDS